MLKAVSFAMGLGTGAGLLAFPAASLALYLLTGRFALPPFAGGRMLSPDEVAEELRAMADQVGTACAPGADEAPAEE